MNRFYIVWSPSGQRPPSVRHWTYSEAATEARRLAKANPGSEFMVLAALSVATVRDPVEVSHFSGALSLPCEGNLDDGIPF